MRAPRAPPSLPCAQTSTYSNAISACGRAGQLGRAIELKNEMLAAGLPMTHNIRLALLHSFAGGLLGGDAWRLHADFCGEELLVLQLQRCARADALQAARPPFPAQRAATSRERGSGLTTLSHLAALPTSLRLRGWPTASATSLR